MLLSLNWLKDFVKIPSSLSAEELAEKMTLHTVEVDEVRHQAEQFHNVVVGKILEVSKHPNADRLQLARVEVGNKKLNIVCGASNIAPGQLVPVALPGAKLGSLKIKEAEVRGIKSEGMLCAEDELGLGSDHSGILILGKEAKVGQKLSSYLKMEDIIIEVDNKSITHRADLWGCYGIAREIAAFSGLSFIHEPNINLKKFINNKGKEGKIKVEVKDNELCPRYMAVKVDGLEIKDSPEWMKKRLIAVGMRPINNIVDITNYVMLELGQPLHAFDSTGIDKIIVRRAKKNETIKTLDGEKRELDDNVLVIADSKKPIAIAGVMGGEENEVNQETESIILEAANFDSISIRKTAQKLSLRTEAAVRFEKFLDPNLAESALARVLELIQESCPRAKIFGSLTDIKNFEINYEPIKLDLDWLADRLGQKIESKKVVSILESLGFKIKILKGNQKNITLEVKIPSWRAGKDISIKEDLLEEVARIYGYNKLEMKMPKTEVAVVRENSDLAIEKKIKNILSAGAKMTEVYNYSFVGEEQLRKTNIDFKNHLRLVNPISIQQGLLRQNLTPNLIENIRVNQAKFDSFEIFEIGSVYFGFAGDINKDNKSKEKLPYQERRLGLVVAGDKKEVVIEKIKGIIEHLLNAFNIDCTYELEEETPAWAEKIAAARILANRKRIGSLAFLSEQVAKKGSIKKKVVLSEINLKDLESVILSAPTKKYQEIPKFPPVVRDLAFVVDDKVLYNQIRDDIVGFDKLIKSVELFDVYQGDKIGTGKKNLAFHVIYQSERTLTGEEIDVLQKKLSNHLEKKFGAVIRNF